MVFGRRKANAGPFVRESRDGTACCIICERVFDSLDAARAHVDALDNMGALADHIRIHASDLASMWRLRRTGAGP